MTVLKKLLLASAAAAALSTGALAADLPYSVPAAVIAVAPYNWTGFYAGVNLGYAWNRADAQAVANGGTGVPAALLPGNPSAPFGLGQDSDGIIGGGQLGYNLQINQMVIGIEADFQFADLRASAQALNGIVASSAQTNVNWMGTVRGRVGFAFDRFLVYATGGLAYGDVDVNGNVASFGVAWNGSTSETRVGYTLGGGVEWAWTNTITTRLEYLYYDLGDANVTLAPVAGTFATGTFNQRHSVDGHIVRAAVNFRF